MDDTNESQGHKSYPGVGNCDAAYEGHAKLPHEIQEQKRHDQSTVPKIADIQNERGDARARPMTSHTTRVFCLCGASSSRTLVQAAEHGCIQCCRVLKAGSELENNERSGLMAAAELGRVGCVKELLEVCGGKVDSQGLTALQRALFGEEMSEKILDCVELLMTSEKETIASGLTRLMLVVISGGVSLAGVQLRGFTASEIEAAASMRDASGKTALHYAARLLDVGGMRCVVQADGGETKIQSNKEPETMRESDAPRTFAAGLAAGALLFTAISDGYLPGWLLFVTVAAICLFFYQEAPKPQAISQQNQMPEAQQTAILFDALLPLAAGAQDRFGRTAMMEAARGGVSKAVHKLLPREHGMVDSEGKTALWHAIFTGSMSLEKRRCIQLLQQYPDELSNSGITQLMLAAYLNSKNTGDALVAQAKRRDVASNFALLYAIRGGSTQWISLLLEKEAGMETEQGVTGLMCAAEQGQVKAVQILVSVEGGRKTKDGLFALQIAITKNRRLCAEKLWEDQREKALLSPELAAAARQQFELQ